MSYRPGQSSLPNKDQTHTRICKLSDGDSIENLSGKYQETNLFPAKESGLHPADVGAIEGHDVGTIEGHDVGGWQILICLLQGYTGGDRWVYWRERNLEQREHLAWEDVAIVQARPTRRERPASLPLTAGIPNQELSGHGSRRDLGPFYSSWWFYHLPSWF